jgi:hypothetical protein
MYPATPEDRFPLGPSEILSARFSKKSKGNFAEWESWLKHEGLFKKRIMNPKTGSQIYLRLDDAISKLAKEKSKKIRGFVVNRDSHYLACWLEPTAWSATVLAIHYLPTQGPYLNLDHRRQKSPQFHI